MSDVKDLLKAILAGEHGPPRLDTVHLACEEALVHIEALEAENAELRARLYAVGALSETPALPEGCAWQPDIVDYTSTVSTPGFNSGIYYMDCEWVTSLSDNAGDPVTCDTLAEAIAAHEAIRQAEEVSDG